MGAVHAAASAGATEMLDVSDGLLRDAGRLARASGVGVELDTVAFAGDLERLRTVADVLGVPAERWVLDGGEDHGLLATFPAGAVLPEPFRAVGRVVAAGPGLVTVDGVAAPARSGWDHFAG
jgi:thiamine-monophosphate kinase